MCGRNIVTIKKCVWSDIYFLCIKCLNDIPNGNEEHINTYLPFPLVIVDITKLNKWKRWH